MSIRADIDPALVVDNIQAGQRTSEDGVALRFATMYDGRLVFCETEGRWFQWSGSIWERCGKSVAFDLARDLCRDLAPVVVGGGELRKVKFVKAVETFAAADARIRVEKEEDSDESALKWNTNPFFLGTPAGTVDLETGRLHPSKPSDMINRATKVAPRRGSCPLWMEFLRQATAGNDEMIRYLQQIAGYSLTGSTKEQSLYFLYGPGGNGKGVFVNTIHKIMGGYATQATMATFTASQHAQHTTDMAFLNGARLVTASETSQGQRWDQQRVKNLTGQDKITARFMRENNFTFEPQFTLVIVGNYKPALDSVDEAMRRRVNIIPFEHKPEKPDLDLQDKLKGEWPVILQWMIEGSLDWQANGMQRAKLVESRTEQYFYDEDSIQHWLDEACEQSEGVTLRLGVVFDSWRAFCKRNEVWAGNSKTFKGLLERNGYEVKHTPEGQLVCGLELKQQHWESSDGWD